MSTIRDSFTILVLGSATLTTLVGCGSGSVIVPTSFARYSSSEGEFACEYPEGWEAKGGGKHGRLWAKFVSGPALIHIKSSIVGNLMSDAQSRASSDGSGLGYEPVDGLHHSLKAEAEDEYDGYADEPGSPKVLQCQLGAARTSEFTSKTSFGGKIHGYRTTIIARDLGLIIYCTCPESDWKAIKPAFDHLLGSFERG